MKEYENFSEKGVPKNYMFTNLDLFERFTQFPPEEFAPYVQISNKGNMKDNISATSKFSLSQNGKTITFAAYSCPEVLPPSFHPHNICLHCVVDIVMKVQIQM